MLELLPGSQTPSRGSVDLKLSRGSGVRAACSRSRGSPWAGEGAPTPPIPQDPSWALLPSPERARVNHPACTFNHLQ